jgi:polysaccharide export outer membrane protein
MRSLILLVASISWISLHSQTVTPASPTPGVASGGNGIQSVSVAVDSDYVLRSNDVVSVSVFQEPDLACSDRIAGDGTISVPLAGRIKIVGLTPVEASRSIKAALEKDYLVNAQVTLSVMEASKQFFTLLGQVAAPGAYALPPNGHLSLMQAIGMAGGFTRSASTGHITVKRKVGGSEQVIKVDGDKLTTGKGSAGFDVLPGDVINVKERIF